MRPYLKLSISLSFHLTLLPLYGNSVEPDMAVCANSSSTQETEAAGSQV